MFNVDYIFVSEKVPKTKSLGLIPCCYALLFVLNDQVYNKTNKMTCTQQILRSAWALSKILQQKIVTFSLSFVLIMCFGCSKGRHIEMVLLSTHNICLIEL